MLCQTEQAVKVFKYNDVAKLLQFKGVYIDLNLLNTMSH
jgi:hypothetical protein